MSVPDLHEPERPPYGAALAVVAIILAGYLASLAPTVTFWDAGELIAADRILGVPHPPGTPLFVMMGHVWGTLFPFGDFAFRTNLLSALCSAAGAGCFFLVLFESLRGLVAGLDPRWARIVRFGGAATGAIIGAFTFTNWQNSNETEVYAVATFTIAAMSWIALRWRATRGTARASRYLLLIVYLGGASIGNHLLALLAGPALVAFFVSTLRRAPAADPMERRREWAHVGVVAGVWVLLIGCGLGNATLATLGAVCFAAALGFAFMGGALVFALLALVIATVGITPYLYIFIRAAQHPMVNEAAPLTYDLASRIKALTDIMSRAQYPVRTPFDDPTVYHGPENPGRSLTIIGLQLKNYFQYFNWQWAKAITPDPMSPIRGVVTAFFLSLGFYGSLAHRRSDRDSWWLLLGLFLVTGLGLVAYMNFKPGYSIGFEEFPDPRNHEVRERDYFFVVSFIGWGLWCGVGLAVLARNALGTLTAAKLRPLAAAVFAVALVPVALNWREASRRQGPDARLAADVAYDLLNTVPPYGILFTYGDNDTFPLWWAQEVAGVRQDVTVICLALANTEWYIRQLGENPVRDFDEATAPPVWRGLHPVKPTWPLHTMTVDEIRASMYSAQLPQDIDVEIGPIRHTYRANTYLSPSDVVSVRILQQNVGRRPIVWAMTAGRSFAGLGRYVVGQGMGFRLELAPRDTARQSDIPYDQELTRRLLWETYRYADLLEPSADASRLETTAGGMASMLSLPFSQLAYTFDQQGNSAEALLNLERAAKLSGNPAIQQALDRYRFGQSQRPAQP